MIHTGQQRRKLLVIGSGFIAAEVAIAARNKWGWNVEILYRNYQNPALANFVSYKLPLQVQAISNLIEEVAPTDVLVALGSSYVPDINKHVDIALEQHLNGGLMILDAISHLSAHRPAKILVIGSASEYGEFSDSAVDESHEPHPRDHYGLIKLAISHVGQYFHQMHGLPVIHARQFNVTGIRQDPRFVLPSICSQIARIADAVDKSSGRRIVVGNIAVRRDFLYIDDVCEAYRVLLTQGAPGELYNVCSGHAWMIGDLITLAAQETGVEVDVEVSQTLLRENDKVQAVICGDPGKLKQLGWRQQVSMKELLLRMIQSYRGSGSNQPVAPIIGNE